MGEFVEQKRKIQEIENKVISLKLQIKVYKTKPVLKQYTVTEYLNEMQKKYVLIQIVKPANNIAIICEKCFVTVNF